jgi:hypothetical protein
VPGLWIRQPGRAVRQVDGVAFPRGGVDEDGDLRPGRTERKGSLMGPGGVRMARISTFVSTTAMGRNRPEQSGQRMGSAPQTCWINSRQSARRRRGRPAKRGSFRKLCRRSVGAARGSCCCPIRSSGPAAPPFGGLWSNSAAMNSGAEKTSVLCLVRRWHSER